jgi:hypothetical protein
MFNELAPATPAGKEHRHMLLVDAVLLAKLLEHLPLFTICQQSAQPPSQNRENVAAPAAFKASRSSPPSVRCSSSRPSAIIIGVFIVSR